LGRKTKGYGILSRNNKKVYAHRLAYEIEHGSLDPEVDVCHKCDFPPCVRPDHLFAGDARANIVDMVSKGRHWLQNRPEDGLTAKLSWDEVREIRRLRKSGATRSEVATKFGVTVWTISDITGKSTWKEKENDSLNTAIETIDLSDDGMSAIVQLDTHSGLETS
jgi:DNA-binding XRE family transcriptional regulator